MDYQKYLSGAIEIATRAGEAIMDVYENGDFETEYKKDDSFSTPPPLTKADRAAHDIIESGLSKISGYPVLSEEGSHDVDGADVFWLVDPLDGTKEFVKKNDEFTVNIALIKNNRPVLGVVFAPALGVLFAAAKGLGSYKELLGKQVPIRAVYNKNKPTVVVSRTHLDSKTEEFLSTLGDFERKSMGSSLKLCLVAEGQASHYPRFAPTYTWDTAAADAIVTIAGGRVVNAETQKPLLYASKKKLNPSFLCLS